MLQTLAILQECKDTTGNTIGIQRKNKKNFALWTSSVSNPGNITASTNNLNSIGSAQEYLNEPVRRKYTCESRNVSTVAAIFLC